MKNRFLIYLLLLFVPATVCGQESVQKKRSTSKSKSSVFELSRSLEQALPVDTIAADYEKVAREFIAKKEYEKAEDYLNRARQLYVQYNNKEKAAYIEREIAKVQEWQNKYDTAIDTYQNAARLSSTAEQKELNENDAKRLQNIRDPLSQSTYIQRNIEILNTTPNFRNEEKALAYQQMAHVSYDMNDQEATLSNLQSAIDISEDEPAQTLLLKREMADVYAAGNRMDKVIDINEEILKEAEQTQDTKVQIEQLQTLSSAYLESSEVAKGIASLQQAYDLAVKENRTLDAKRSLELLVAQYQKQNNNKKALEVYADYLDRLDVMVKADSTLVDEKIVQVQEDKIAQLENERQLKDQIIHQQDLNNTLLTVGLLVVLLAFVVASFAARSILKKNKKIALQSLRREMNPHFIFNSLNSVNQFIAQNNELEANKYLSSYSRLMRNMMENSNKDFTALSTEVEQLREYLDLEQMRFHDKFTYTIDVGDTLDTDAIQVPNMLIQPQLENAVWHGLRYKESGGVLRLSFQQEGNNLLVKIEDNGIGIKKSREIKTKHQREHQSRGLTNTYERIALLNSLYKCRIKMEIIDKTGEETGVIVTITVQKKWE